MQNLPCDNEFYLHENKHLASFWNRGLWELENGQLGELTSGLSRFRWRQYMYSFCLEASLAGSEIPEVFRIGNWMIRCNCAPLFLISLLVACCLTISLVALFFDTPDRKITRVKPLMAVLGFPCIRDGPLEKLWGGGGGGGGGTKKNIRAREI